MERQISSETSKRIMENGDQDLEYQYIIKKERKQLICRIAIYIVAYLVFFSLPFLSTSNDKYSMILYECSLTIVSIIVCFCIEVGCFPSKATVLYD